ncbi:MAG: hypothetical protein J6N55_12925 [Anaerovibrio sp.]|uniref:hypothetical protein n=1 Tax=Anaerovibrio sp. TaxID=1872532 RepID=UPI001AFF612E|nr:hypothetical protein [Anaerovibrio sp.]MBO6247168.1 hypothetical protein [Anaerovibrio sp.]
MATKSISKNINVKGRKQVKKLVDALEHANQHRGKTVNMSSTVTEVKEDEVNEFFVNYL